MRGWWITSGFVKRVGVVVVGLMILGVGLIQGVIAMQRKVAWQGGRIESVEKVQVSGGRFVTGSRDVYSLKIVTDSGLQLVADGMDGVHGKPFSSERVWTAYDPDDGTVELVRLYSSAGIWVSTYDIDQSELNQRSWLLGLKRSRLNGLIVAGCLVIFGGFFLEARRAPARY